MSSVAALRLGLNPVEFRKYLCHVVYVPCANGGADEEHAEFGHSNADRIAAEAMAKELGGYVMREKRSM